MTPPACAPVHLRRLVPPLLAALPTRDVPVLTRELVYTAITRARRQVTVLGDRQLLKNGVHRRAQRFSGIAERLAQK